MDPEDKGYHVALLREAHTKAYATSPKPTGGWWFTPSKPPYVFETREHAEAARTSCEAAYTQRLANGWVFTVEAVE